MVNFETKALKQLGITSDNRDQSENTGKGFLLAGQKQVDIRNIFFYKKNGYLEQLNFGMKISEIKRVISKYINC